jgi:hypothetical protein
VHVSGEAPRITGINAYRFSIPNGSYSTRIGIVVKTNFFYFSINTPMGKQAEKIFPQKESPIALE